MQPATSARVSSSVSGNRTTNGYSTRQSVASVTCDTRAKPSNAMLSFFVARREHAHGPGPQRHGIAERAFEAQHGGARRIDELRHFASRSESASPRARALSCRRFSISSSRCVMAATRSRRRFGLSMQVVLQIGIALDDPDVAQDFEEHPRGAPRAPLAAQFAQHVPQRRSEQADDDLPVGERRVVVGNLPQPRCGGGRILRIQNPIGNGVHGARSLSQCSRHLMCACAHSSLPLTAYAAQSRTTLPLAPESIVAKAASNSSTA